MRTVEIVKGRWPEILKHYGLPDITGTKHHQGNCPICGSKGKFRIDNKNDNGSWICVCGSGDGWGLLTRTQGKDFKTLAREIDRLLGNYYHSEKDKLSAPKDTQTLFHHVSRKFAALSPLRGSSAQQYLAQRGIQALPTMHSRFNPKEKTPFGIKQAIWSIATDDKGKACYLHRTILDGVAKANFNGNKRMMKLQEDSYLKFAGSVAIRLFPVSSTLGIAEGIETALSCKQIYGCNTWSALNAGFMEKFIAPQGVHHLIIFADRDDNGTGLSAAFHCGNRNILSGNDVDMVSIRWPDKGDFNDMMINGAKVYQEQLFKRRVALRHI